MGPWEHSIHFAPCAWGKEKDGEKRERPKVRVQRVVRADWRLGWIRHRVALEDSKAKVIPGKLLLLSWKNFHTTLG